MTKAGSKCWLINTGWTGGKFGIGKRCPLKATRAIVDAIHDGSLAKSEFENFGVFNLAIPKTLAGVDDKLLNPAKAWQDTKAFEFERNKLGKMFTEAFQKYSSDCTPAVREAGPKLSE